MPSMTREHLRISKLSLFVLVVLLATAACAPALRPFRPHDKSIENPLLQLSTSAGFTIAPTQGVAPAVGGRLAEEVVVALNNFALAASTAAPTGDAILVESQSRIAENKHGAPRLTIRWTLSDPRLTVAGTYDLQMPIVPDQWTGGSPALLKLIAADAARGIANLLHGTTQQTIASRAPVTLAIVGIDGIFNDDRQALLIAFRL